MIKAIFFDLDGVLTTDAKGSLTMSRNLCDAVPGLFQQEVLDCYRQDIEQLNIGRRTLQEVWGRICATFKIPIGGLVKAEDFLAQIEYDMDDSDHFFFMSKLAEGFRDIPQPHHEKMREKTREYGFENSSTLIDFVRKEASTEEAIESSFPDIAKRLEEIRVFCRGIFSARKSVLAAPDPDKETHAASVVENPPHKLSDLFIIPEAYVLTESTARYYGSLTPPLDVMKKMRAIHYETTFDLPPSTARHLPYENGINTHLFKPKFFTATPDADEVKCIVPCPEVLAHSLRSLAAFAHALNRKDISVTIEENRRPYG